MIIGSEIKLSIGHRGTHLTDANRQSQKQPFVVIREASFGEYLDDLKSIGVFEDTLNHFGSFESFKHDYFYEVSTD